jgi:membrane protein
MMLVERRRNLKKIESILKELIRRYSEHHLQQIGGSLAYFFLLSIFPLLIFLNAILGLFDFALHDILVSIQPLIPHYVFDILDNYITSIASRENTTILSLGLIGTLYTASIAVNSIFHAILKAYNQTNHRSWLLTKALALMFTCLIGFTLFLSLILPLIGQGFLEFVNQYFVVPEIIFFIWNILRWSVTPLLIMTTLALLYKIIPYTPYKQSIWPGTIFATILWMITSSLFAIYVNEFSNYSAVYGSLGAVIALLVWLFLTGIIIILGAELNDILDHLE